MYLPVRQSRVMLSQRAAAAGTPSGPVGPAGSGVAPAGAAPSVTELHATVQKHSAELRRLAVAQRRQELEDEFVKGETGAGDAWSA